MTTDELAIAVALCRSLGGPESKIEFMRMSEQAQAYYAKHAAAVRDAVLVDLDKTIAERCSERIFAIQAEKEAALAKHQEELFATRLACDYANDMVTLAKVTIEKREAELARLTSERDTELDSLNNQCDLALAAHRSLKAELSRLTAERDQAIANTDHSGCTEEIDKVYGKLNVQIDESEYLRAELAKMTQERDQALAERLKWPTTNDDPQQFDQRHTMNCGAYAGSDDPCTCGLDWRIKLARVTAERDQAQAELVKFTGDMGRTWHQDRANLIREASDATSDLDQARRNRDQALAALDTAAGRIAELEGELAEMTGDRNVQVDISRRLANRINELTR